MPTVMSGRRPASSFSPRLWELQRLAVCAVVALAPMMLAGRASATVPNGPSSGPTISSNAHYVAFTSSASNLVSGDTNGASDVFVTDLGTGSTERVSVNATGQQANGPSSGPVMSVEGRYVAFQSSASNLVSGDSPGTLDIFVHDRQQEIVRRIPGAWSPAISADGRYLAFS